MKLLTERVAPGGWVIFAPEVPVVDTARVTIGRSTQAAYVEDGRLLVRCPEGATGRVPVAVDGVQVGVLIVEG